MPYPVQTFPNFAALLSYINTEWVTNGNGDITGIVGNNVVNGLLNFITESPLNYGKTQVSVIPTAVVASKPVIVFTTAPSAFSWGNNIYNQYVLINTTNNIIPFANGFYYRDIDLAAKINVQPKTTLVMYKMGTDEWIGVTYGIPSGTIIPYPITHEVTSDEANVTHLTNINWVGVQNVNWAIVNNFPYQGLFDFTFDGDIGTFFFDIGNTYTFQTGDKFTSYGNKTL